jgi:hypothetical protein
VPMAALFFELIFQHHLLLSPTNILQIKPY